MDQIEVVERLHRPTLEQFKEQYLAPGRPVVLTGAMDDWPALHAWTRPYLACRAGKRQVVVRSAPAGDFSITPEEGPRYLREEMTFAELLEQLDEPRAERLYYLQGECLEEKLPELLSDIRVPVYVDQARLTGCRLWFGPGQRVALHYDTGHNLLALIRGVKRLTLFDPAQLPFLYHSPIEGPNSSYPYSRVDLDQPDIERFPQFAHSRPVEVEIGAGEILFMPAFWWHHVVSEGENVAVNFWWNLLADRDLASLGRAFSAFSNAVKLLPPEWHAHIRRLTNEFVLP